MRIATILLSLSLLFTACMKAPDPSQAGSPQHNSAMPHAEGGPPPAADSGSSGGMELAFAAPAGWVEAPGGNAFTVAKWSFEGGGQCTVTAVGGDVAANLQRWEQQFIVEGEGLHTEEVADARYPATLAVVSGTLTSTQQLGGGEPRENWMLVGFALPETPVGSLYIKALGPKELMLAQKDDIVAAVAKMEIQ